MRKFLTLILSLMVFVIIVPFASAKNTKRPSYMPKVLWAIGMCEVGLNPIHHTRDYEGMFGFYRGTWQDYKPVGYPAHAYLANVRQQVIVAKILVKKFGYSPWGCYTNGDYRYWLSRSA